MKRFGVWLAVLGLLALPELGYPAGTIAPFPLHQFFDNNGDPAASYRLFVYLAGTSTKQNTYQDVGLATPHTNPIVMNSAGRPPAGIFLDAKSHKLVLCAAGSDDPCSSPVWTIDNVSAVSATLPQQDIIVTAGTTLSGNDWVYVSAGDGGRTAGRWYHTDADLTYASTTASAIGMVTGLTAAAGETTTVRIAGTLTPTPALSAGSIYYVSTAEGEITTSAPTNARPVGVAQGITSLVLSHWAPTADASRTWGGRVTTSAQIMGDGIKTFPQPPVFEAGGAGAPAATRVSGRITTNTTNVGNVGGGTDDLMSYSIPAGILANDGQVLRFTAMGTTANNANAKTIACLYGGSTIISRAVSASIAGVWRVQGEITRLTATTQKAYAEMAHGAVNTGASDWTMGRVLPTETLSNSVILKCTGAATSNDDIVQEQLILEVVG